MNKRNITSIILAISFCSATINLYAQESSVEFLNSGKVFPRNVPISEAVRVGDTLYMSGQIGIVPGTMDLAPGGVEGETRQLMDNINTVLKENGLSMGNIVKCLVMIDDISQWGTFNDIYKTYFEAPYPARSAFGADGLALEAALEVECIAIGRK